MTQPETTPTAPTLNRAVVALGMARDLATVDGLLCESHTDQPATWAWAAMGIRPAAMGLCDGCVVETDEQAGWREVATRENGAVVKATATYAEAIAPVSSLR